MLDSRFERPQHSGFINGVPVHGMVHRIGVAGKASVLLGDIWPRSVADRDRLLSQSGLTYQGLCLDENGRTCSIELPIQWTGPSIDGHLCFCARDPLPDRWVLQQMQLGAASRS